MEQDMKLATIDTTNPANIENQMVVGDYYLDAPRPEVDPDFYEASLALAKLKAKNATFSELHAKIDIIYVIESLPPEIQEMIDTRQRAMLVGLMMRDIRA